MIEDILKDLRELRDEIALNMMSYGLSFTNEEIASFNEFTNIIKKNIHTLSICSPY